MTVSSLRNEIAAAAARMIAEDGLDYSTAKRKAVKMLLGPTSLPRGEVLPDNDLIEEEVRQYQQLFLADTQPQRLLHLRQVAVQVMEKLAPFNPYLVGPVWTGTAGEHTDVALQCFTDASKEVEIFLINERVDYQVGERPDFRGRGTVEALFFMWGRDGVMVSVYDPRALRGALKPNSAGKVERGNVEAVRALIAATQAESGQG